MVVWDRVRALSTDLLLFACWTRVQHALYDHHLGASVERGYQALAVDEDRQVFAQVLWCGSEHWQGYLQQMWFRGSHANIGGQVGLFPDSRPPANIPVVWLLSQAGAYGL